MNDAAFFALWILQVMQAGIYGLMFALVLKPRWKFTRWAMILILMAFSVLPVYFKITTSVRDGRNILSIVLINGGFFLYAVFGFADRFPKKAIVFLMVESVSILSELLLYFFIDTSQYLDDGLRMLPSGWIISLAACCILIILAAVFLFLYFRFWEKIEFHVSHLLLFLIFPVSQILCYFLINREYQLEKGNLLYRNPVLLLLVPAGIIGNAALLYIMAEQTRQEGAKRSLQEMMHLRSLEKMHYEALESHLHEMEKMRHDLNSQILAVTKLIEEKDYGNAAIVLNEFKGAMDHATGEGKKYCGNAVVNAVMAEKEQECERNGITLTADLKMGELEHISLLHQYSLFSNLLDNAIHAASVFDGERYVRIRALLQGAYLTVRVMNSSDDPAGKRSGRKGYGIEIIRDIVGTYQGHYSGKWKDGAYEAIVSIVVDP